MMKTVAGDILLSNAQVIAHGVAPNDDFKHGLALALREKWPAMYKDFRHYCQTQHPKPGTLWSWSGVDNTHIICLFTQEGTISHTGGGVGQANLPNVTHCLKALRHEIEEQGYKSLAIPALATGVGGLDWGKVEPLLQEYLGSLKIPVYIYETYRAGVVANEG